MSGILIFPELPLDAAAPVGPGPIRLGRELRKNLFCHKHVLHNQVDAYGIKRAPEPEDDGHPEGYDPRPLRLRLVPRMVRLARRFMPKPKRAAAWTREKTEIS